MVAGTWNPLSPKAGEDVTAHPLADLSVLDRFKSAPFPPGYPDDVRTFYSSDRRPTWRAGIPDRKRET